MYIVWFRRMLMLPLLGANEMQMYGHEDDEQNKGV